MRNTDPAVATGFRPAEGQAVETIGRGLPKLGRGTKIAYGIGAMVEGVSAQAIALFLFFYATAVCGLSSALAGAALAVGLVLDAIVDPLIGSTSDGWHSRLGRRLPFMLLGFPLAAVCLILVFALPRGLSGIALFLWLSGVLIALRMSISLFLLPYTAVGAELSDNHAERSSIVAWRWTAQMVGALLAVVLGFGIFFGGEGGLLRRASYLPFGATLAGLVVIAALVASRAVFMTRERQHPPPPRTARRHLAFAGEVTEIFRNHSFRVLFVGALLLFTGLAISGTLSIHSNTYFWRLTPQQIQLVTLALTIGLIVGAPLAAPMMKVMQKRTVLVIGEVGLGTAFAAPVVLRLCGALPLTGNGLVAVLAIFVFAGGVLMAAAAVAFNSMMADAADEHEQLFGARREGLYFAGWSFALKAATGLGSLVAGVGLQLIGFENAGRAAGAVAVASPETIRWLGALQGIGAGLLAILAAGVCLLYRLDYQKHGGILRELDQRRLLASARVVIAP